jgi:hypothetical protein
VQIYQFFFESHNEKSVTDDSLNLLIKIYLNYFILIFYYELCFRGLGIGDWGLGIGDWAQSPIPNPQNKVNFFLKILICKKL